MCIALVNSKNVGAVFYINTMARKANAYLMGTKLHLSSLAMCWCRLQVQFIKEIFIALVNETNKSINIGSSVQ